MQKFECIMPSGLGPCEREKMFVQSFRFTHNLLGLLVDKLQVAGYESGNHNRPDTLPTEGGW